MGIEGLAERPPWAARVRAISGTSAGAAFYVGDRFVVTCAHVVAQALNSDPREVAPPSGPLLVEFPFAEPEASVTAVVAERGWVAQGVDRQGDIAVLRLRELPEGVLAPPLMGARMLRKHSFWAFGFPSSEPRGHWADGQILGQAGKGWVEIGRGEQTSRQVVRGYSGAAVWDEAVEAVVGMVVATVPSSQSKAAFMVPMEEVKRSLPHFFEQAGTIPTGGSSAGFTYRVSRGSTRLGPVTSGRSSRRARALVAVSAAACIALLFRSDSPRHIALPAQGVPMMAQTAIGDRPEFMVAAALPSGELMVCSRTDDNWATPWKGPTVSNMAGRRVEAGALVWSSFGSSGRAELVFREGDRLWYSFRDETLRWVEPSPLEAYSTSTAAVSGESAKPVTGVAGTPAFLQLTPPSGRRHGDFMVVSPTVSGELAVYRGDTSGTDTRWYGPQIVNDVRNAESVAAAEAVDRGGLELVVRSRDRLFQATRDASGLWSTASPIATVDGVVTGITGSIAMVRGRQGNLELVAPIIAGGAFHFWRDEGNGRWSRGYPVGVATDAIGAFGMTTNIDRPVRLAALARIEDQLVMFVRELEPFERSPQGFVCGDRGVRYL